MASAFQRPHQRKPGGKWTAKYKDAHGRWQTRVGCTSKSLTVELARRLETEAMLVREGMVDPRDVSAKEAAKRPLEKHIGDYHDELIARGNCKEHCADTVSLVRRLLASVKINSIARIAADPIRVQLGRIARSRSASTANHAQRAIKSFTRWLTDGKRLKEDPLLSLRSTYNVEADRKRIRRCLASEDLVLLVDGTMEAGPLRKWKPRLPVDGRAMTISGLDRAMLYLVAMITGFRRDELSVLTPERFDLGDDPAIRLLGEETKDHLPVIQPIRREAAAKLVDWLATKQPGKPVFLDMPNRTAEMLSLDLERLGIPVTTIAGVCDFHALRVAYITHLGRIKGIDPETLRVLARHKKFETTQRYLRTDDEIKRKAIEGGE